jgi:hypothetical protein
MRALNAVVAFTDSSPPYYVDDVWNNGSVLAFANANSIPIYAIGFQYATPANLPQYQALGLSSPSGYYAYANDPGQMEAFYYEVVALMDAQLRTLYKVTWFTTGSGGQLLDVDITVNYSTQGSDFSDSDIELDHPL